MGQCCHSNDPTNKEIDNRLEDESKITQRHHKLMLIGSGSSGKSTIFKQLNWLYATDQDIPPQADPSSGQQVPDIRKHCIEGIATLIIKCAALYNSDNNKYDKLNLKQVEQTKPNTFKDIKLILSIYKENDPNYTIDKDIISYLGSKILPIFNLECLQYTYKWKKLYDIADNITYFFENAELIFQSNYMPSREDLLKARIRTTGLIKTKLEIKHKTTNEINTFEIWDAGGQRTERNKWMHQFTGVTALLFVAALSHYNQVIFEDDSVNAMHESINVFNDTVNKRYFEKTQIILFLNKKDLFRQSLSEGNNLDLCFANHKDWKLPKKQWNVNDNYDPNKHKNSNKKHENYFNKCHTKAIEFIKYIYVSQNVFNKTIYTHVTCATDKDNVDNVFWDVQNNILKENLIKSGFYPQ